MEKNKLRTKPLTLCIMSVAEFGALSVESG